MFNHSLSQILSLVWKLLTVLIIPVIMLIYVKVTNALYPPFSFQELDQGENSHKWIILAIYLSFLLCWKRLNPAVTTALKKLEY